MSDTQTDLHALAAPPVAAKKPLTRVHHGDTVVDDYDWLRDKENPEVIAHLNAENAYAERLLSPLRGVRDEIVEEIRSHTQETDASVPYRDGDYWYLTRTRKGDNYPRYSRIPVALSADIPVLDPDSDELLDGELVFLDAQALSEGHEFFQLGGVAVHDGAMRLAYSVDTTGGEVFDLVIADAMTGEVIDDAVKNVAYGLEFSTDGAHVVYARNDEAWRQCEIWVHTIGEDAESDRLVYREDDEKFSVYMSASRDHSHLLLHAASRSTSEEFLLPLSDPFAEPRTVAGRHPGLEYAAEYAGDQLLVVHNRDHVGFALARMDLDAVGPDGADAWQEILAPADGERIEDVDAFSTHAAITMRSGGLPTVRVLPRAGNTQGGGLGWNTDDAWDISHGGELDAVNLSHNRNWEEQAIRYTLSSMLTPATVAEVPVAPTAAGAAREPRILKVTNVPNYDPSQYAEKRLWATAADGTQIPISLVTRASLAPDGTNPGFLYGYGSYEIPTDPMLVVNWLSLLDRGVAVAIAHVRGGGEMGRQWYDGGKLLNKKNTFTDFVDAAHFLTREGWFDPARVAAEGGSAGGLLMGAIANLAPETFRVVHARVPFVDALTTILDPSLPLTVGEWEEWGNPLEDPEVYRYMKEYTPYENIANVQYPAILATTSLNDIRVFFVEPAKWVARLRADTLNYAGGEQVPERPIAFKCEMVAGHGGRSGRYAQWEQRAEELAFILDQLGATQKI